MLNVFLVVFYAKTVHAGLLPIMQRMNSQVLITEPSSSQVYLIPSNNASSAMLVKVVTESDGLIQTMTMPPRMSLGPPPGDGVTSREPLRETLFETARDGGYGGGGYNSYGGLTTDPVSLLSLLTLGALVIRSLLSLTTTAAGRELKRNPLHWVAELEDWLPRHLLDFLKEIEAESLAQVRSFSGSLWHLRTVGNEQEESQKRNDCLRRVLCEHTLASEESNKLMKMMFDTTLVGAAWWYGDRDSTSYIDTMRGMTKTYQPESIEKHCSKSTPLCPDIVDAKARNSRFFVEQVLSLFGL